jgi:hypothetical protein
MADAFTLIEADKFDARRGFTRWILPGAGANFPGRPQATVDLWTNRDGRLFARFSSAGYIYHYEIRSIEQSAITEDLQDTVSDFLEEKLVTWVI